MLPATGLAIAKAATSFAIALALAAALLAELEVTPERIEAWTVRHQDRAVGRYPEALIVPAWELVNGLQ